MPENVESELKKQLSTQKKRIPKEKLLKARFSLFYEQATNAIVPVFVAIGIMLYLTHDSASPLMLLSWVTLTLISYRARFWLRSRHLAVAEQDESSRRWLAYTIVTVSFTGLCWGIGSLLLFPESHIQQILVILIVGFIASGNSITHAALPVVSQAFIVSSLSPILIYLFFMRESEYINAASVLLLFMLTLLVLTYKSQRSIVNSICASIASDILVEHFKTVSDETQELNAALKKENAERLRVEEELRRSEHELELILENLPDTYYRTDKNGNLVKLSTSIETVLGYRIDEVLGTKLADFYVDPNGREKFLAVLKEHNGHVMNYEAALRHKDGHEVWVSTSARFYFDADGNLSGVEGVTRDISEKKLYEKKLFEEKERAQVTLEAINDVVISTNVSGVVEYATPVLEEYLGWKLYEIKGRKVSEILTLIDEESGEQLPDPVTQCLQSGKRVDCKQSALIMHKDNKISYSVEVTVAPIKDHNEQVIGSVVAIHDITELRGMARELSYQATHDPLTGLANRREFESRVEDLLESARREGLVHALCYLDLDQFKVINDTCGHIAGDELLRQLAPLLQRGIRTTDLLARLGGDEFGILLQGCGQMKAREIVTGLHDTLKEFRFLWQDKVFDIGGSMGLVTITEHSGTLSDILSDADAACYIAKEQGRNRIHINESDKMVVAQHKGRMQWYTRINRALEDGRFELHFQAIRPAMAGERGISVQGEFLLRMQSENGDLIAPGIFIPAAERYHLMPGIDGWVVREVLKVLGRYHVEGEDGGEIYTINLSAQSLGEEYFLAFLQEQISNSGVVPHRLCFEITETAAISNLTSAIGFIEELKSLGCRFALDDFGSGVSSLANLKKLPVDYVKIDGEFVRGMRHDPADRAMVNSIIDISKVMGLHTIAEFVEDEELAGILADMGVDYVQGYHVGRPRSVSDVFTKH